MAETSLPDRAQALNCELPFLEENLDSAAVKNRLEASLRELTELINLALKSDLTVYHPLTLSRYLEEAIGEQLSEVKVMCKALWLATCQGLVSRPSGRRTDA